MSAIIVKILIWTVEEKQALCDSERISLCDTLILSFLYSQGAIKEIPNYS